TEHYKGFRFDVGGHRFFSRSSEIEALWEEILGDQLIMRERKSGYFIGANCSTTHYARSMH
ncbi:MAG: hypothetical protein OET46_13290, partial [Xanthomonadales bacterium]|nr:hypothetical protein [Xanthomonadales bacterium]